MAEYLISVVVTSTLVGFISYLSYPMKSERAMRFAASVLIIYTVITPLVSFVSNFSDGGAGQIIEDIKTETPSLDDKDYLEVTQTAICDSIRELILSKYGMDGENLKVYLFNFDFREMKAEKIKVIITGKGALLDWRGIEQYVTGLGLGECEVEIEFG